jgi:predicted nucleic acid-binding Zn ribbon protein
MKFKEFYEKFTKETIEVFTEAPKNNVTQDRIVDAWLVHETLETNKKLVRATWILAIGTLILSIITLYLTFFTNAT